MHVNYNLKGRILSKIPNGFSIIQVVIASGILVIVMFAMTTMITNMQRGTNANKFRIDANVVNEEMRALLSNSFACQNTFGGLVAQPSSTYPITMIKDGSMSPGISKYSTGSVYGDQSLKLISMSFSDYVPGATVYSAQMTLRNVYQTTKSSLGVQSVTASINIDLTLDSAKKITACVALAKMSDGIWQRSTSNMNNIFYVSSSTGGNVGIGTSIPSQDLEIVGNDKSTTVLLTNTNSTVARNPGFHIYNYQGSTAGGTPGFSGFSARGSSTAVSPVQAGDNLITFEGWGQGNQSLFGAGMSIVAEQNFSAGISPASIVFGNCPTGNCTTSSNAGYEERVRISSEGKVAIGMKGLLPVAMLDMQADDSICCDNGLLIRESSTGLTAPSVVVADNANNKIGSLGGAPWNGAFSNWALSGDLVVAAKNRIILGTTVVPGPPTYSPGRVIIDNTGKVGIGISAPSYLLDVGNGPTVTTVNLRVNGAVSASNLFGSLGNTTGALGIYSDDTMANGWTAHGATSPTSQNKILGYAGGNAQIAVTTTGVGIGTTTPNEKLDVIGNLKLTGVGHASSWTTTSDKRLKENINIIEDVLERTLALRGVSFNWKKKMPGSIVKNNDIGLIAQEVEKVFPQVVYTNNQGIKSVDYSRLVAPLIESVKVLNEKNKVNFEDISHRIDILQKENFEKEKQIHKLETELSLIKEKLHIDR